MVETLFCVQCGLHLAAGAGFCGRCGAAVAGAWSSQAPAALPAEPNGDAMVDPLGDDWVAVRRRLEKATLGQYEIRDQLGIGGMAAVFLGQQLSLNRRVAIKVMRPSLMHAMPGDDSLVSRFMLEAQTVAALEHRNIVRMVEIRADSGLNFFVMQYIDGRSLDRVVRSAGPLSIRVVRALMAQVMAGLGYAHRRRVVHRDVKPSNIMLDAEGNAIVTDFGIAKVLDPLFTRPNLTRTNQAIGSPVYMSPEQCLASPVTGASDQYSLGAVCYELLTGGPPFDAPGAAVMLAHLQDPPRPLRAVRHDCPPSLEAAVLRMLAKKPEDRFPTLADAASAMGARLPEEHDPVWGELQALAAPMDGDPGQVIKGTPGSPLVVDRVASSASVGSAASAVSSAPTLPLETRTAANRATWGRVARWTTGAILLSGVAWSLQHQLRGDRPASPPPPAVVPSEPSSTAPAPADPPAPKSETPPESAPQSTPVPDPSPRGTSEPRPEPSGRLELRPSAIQLAPGDSLPLRLSRNGSLLVGNGWSSSAPDVARVDRGRVFALGPGLALITAEYGTNKVSARVTVALPAGSQIHVDLPPDTLFLGDSLVARAHLAIPGKPDKTVAPLWSSESPGIVGISPNGVYRGLRAGTARIHARFWGLDGSAPVLVGEVVAVVTPAPAAPEESPPIAKPSLSESLPPAVTRLAASETCQLALLTQDRAVLPRVLARSTERDRKAFDRLQSLFEHQEWQVKTQLSGRPRPIADSGGVHSQDFTVRIDYRDSFGSGKSLRLLFRASETSNGAGECRVITGF